MSLNKKRWSFYLHFVVLFVLPAWASLPLSSSQILKESTLTFLKNGDSSQLSFYQKGEESYLAIEQVAQLASAQLRWQSVTQQACLSNTEGLLCFNWDLHTIQKNGRTIKNNVPLQFEKNQLLVPLVFMTSKDFQSFSDSDFHWNPKEKELVQSGSILLQQPHVERFSDRYEIRIQTPEKGAQSLIEQSPSRIWLRFVRAHSAGSQVFEGDDVVREVKIVQRRHSADVIIAFGDRAKDNDVYYDDEKKELVITVQVNSSNALLASNISHPKKRIVKSSGKTSIPVKKPPASLSQTPLPLPKIEKVSPKKITSSDRKGLLTIVVDAGHGGMDAGAIGPRGTLEKDINLEVARALAKQLKKEKNIQVIMTRESDEFVTLNSRADIANAANADLFVSIHCNSSLSSKSMGFETYFLSPDATDKAAEAVARVENSVVALETKKGTASAKLESLLASMAVHDQINESSRFASMLVRSVKQVSGQDKAAVKEADFFVLRGAQMPAVLVELEYLSHPVSEVKLRSSRFQAHLVRGLVDGILAFDKQVRREKESMAVQVNPPANKTER